MEDKLSVNNYLKLKDKCQIRCCNNFSNDIIDLLKKTSYFLKVLNSWSLLIYLPLFNPCIFDFLSWLKSFKGIIPLALCLSICTGIQGNYHGIQSFFQIISFRYLFHLLSSKFFCPYGL